MTILIAEVKTQSPFGYKSNKTWEELAQTACEYGDWVSIHTDPRWGGSWEHLNTARKLTGKPILAKGYHSTDDDVRKAIELGANYVLVVNRMPSDELLPYCLLEPHTIADLFKLPQSAKAVWNSRDLQRNGESKFHTFAYARKLHSGFLCQASFIKCQGDVHPKANAILVGEGLEEYLTRSGRKH